MEEFTKSCFLCLRTLDIRQFYKCGKAKDGLGSYCKKCTRAYNRYRKEQEYKVAGKTFRKKKIVFEVAPTPTPSSKPQISFPEAVFEQTFT